MVFEAWQVTTPRRQGVCSIFQGVQSRRPRKAGRNRQRKLFMVCPVWKGPCDILSELPCLGQWHMLYPPGARIYSQSLRSGQAGKPPRAQPRSVSGSPPAPRLWWPQTLAGLGLSAASRACAFLMPLPALLVLCQGKVPTLQLLDFLWLPADSASQAVALLQSGVALPNRAWVCSLSERCFCRDTASTTSGEEVSRLRQE